MTINNCPSTLKKGFQTYSPQGAKVLFDGQKVSHVLDFDIDDFRKVDGWLIEAMHRISVSGVQEKFPAIITDSKIRIASSNERSTFILKPSPWDPTLQNRKQIPANEHLTMQIASQVYGIQTAANGLCFTPKGQTVYITRRFDIMSDGTKLLMEDIATTAGKSEQVGGLNFKYNGSYAEIAAAIRKSVAAWMVDIERFFELVVFNYIYANGDAHMKNFSLIKQGETYRLAPAYDLLNTNLHVEGDDFGLDGGFSSEIEKSDVYEKTGHPCRLDFERFGASIGILAPRAKRILDKYTSIPESAKTLISNSFLNEKMKRTYLNTVKVRISRFNRNSD